MMSSKTHFLQENNLFSLSGLHCLNKTDLWENLRMCRCVETSRDLMVMMM